MIADFKPKQTSYESLMGKMPAGDRRHLLATIDECFVQSAILQNSMRSSAPVTFMLQTEPRTHGLYIQTAPQKERASLMEELGIEHLSRVLAYDQEEGLVLPRLKRIVSLKDIIGFSQELFRYVDELERTKTIAIPDGKKTVTVCVHGLNAFSGRYRFRDGTEKQFDVETPYHTWFEHFFKKAMLDRNPETYFR